jgi:cytochrome c-type biogenesis protein CcmH
MAAEDGEKGATIIVDRHESGSGFGRIALIVAAAIALVAVAIGIWKRPSAAPTAVAPTPGAEAATQPAGGNLDDRIKELEAAAKAAPKDAEAWRKLGWAYYGTEQFQKSADAYKHATEIDPKNVESWSALGEALVYTGTADQPLKPEAVAAFTKAHEIDAKDPRARYFLAVSKDLNGDHKGAIDDWFALLKDSPPGAPWEDSLRATIKRAGDKNHIEVASRMPPPTNPHNAAAAATDAIPGPTPEQMQAARQLPPGQQDAMVNQMVESLAGKLKANPKDAEGWLRLMRARMVLGQQAQAGQALKDGKAAFAGDAATQGHLTEGARALNVPGA